MKNPKDFKDEDLERLKGYVGEEKAKKYFEDNNYPFKLIGILYLYTEIRLFAKRNPFLFLAIIIFILLIIGVSLHSKFFY